MVWKSVHEVVQGEDSRKKELKTRGKGSEICTDSWREKAGQQGEQAERTRTNHKERENHFVRSITDIRSPASYLVGSQMADKENARSGDN
ncbi:uncharacterized protein LJ206_015140 isoform 2-T2 [Theristicus caerulescens]